MYAELKLLQGEGKVEQSKRKIMDIWLEVQI